MGSTLFKFRAKGEWVRDGGTEFWFRALINRPNFQGSEVPWIQDFVNETQEWLDCNWMMTLAGLCFDKYLIDESRISFMVEEILMLHKELRVMANGVEIVYYLDDQVSSDYLIWMMNVIENLLLHPEKLSITIDSKK